MTDTKRFDIFFTKSRRSIKIMKSSIWFLLFFCFFYIKGYTKGKAAKRPSYRAAARPFLELVGPLRGPRKRI